MIERITLKNWKGHSAIVCEFKKGLNFIIGPNGIGKSSILEAIYYGITGEVKSRAALKKMKTIGSKGPIKIDINILRNDIKYKIERIYQNNKTEHHFYNLTENHKISGKNNVEIEILKLFDTKKVFLKRMFYYGEGDIFSVISNSKRKNNLREYIEDLIGIEGLKEFQKIIGSYKTEFNKKRKEFDYDLDQMITLTTGVAISEEKKKLFKRKEELKDRRKTLEKQLSRSKRENLILEQKINHINNIEKMTREILNLELFEANLLNLIEYLTEEIQTDKKELKNLDADIDKESIKLEQIEKKGYILKNIFNILKSLNEDEKSSCPVCDRSFDEVSYDIAFGKKKKYIETQSSIDNIKSNLADLHYKHQNSKQKIENKLWLSKEIKNLSSEWEKTYQDYELKKKRSADLEPLINTYKSELNELKREIEDITAKQVKLSNINIKDGLEKKIDEHYVQSKIKRMNNSIFLSEFLEDVIDKTLYDIKLEYLQPLTQKISDIWELIIKDKDREVSFDKYLNPILKFKGQEVGFSNLSGGEKTILTIITKSLLMHQFSNINFIVLDEPLEHLDIINRAQLIEFLGRFYDADLIKQLIITTFEESLTRNLIDNDDVYIISLGSIKKYPEILENKG